MSNMTFTTVTYLRNTDGTINQDFYRVVVEYPARTKPRLLSGFEFAPAVAMRAGERRSRAISSNFRRYRITRDLKLLRKLLSFQGFNTTTAWEIDESDLP